MPVLPELFQLRVLLDPGHHGTRKRNPSHMYLLAFHGSLRRLPPVRPVQRPLHPMFQLLRVQLAEIHLYLRREPPFPVWKTSSRHVFHIDVTLEYCVGLQHFGKRFVYHSGPIFCHYWHRFFDASAVAFGSRSATVRATRTCSPVHDCQGLVHARLVLSPSHRSRLHVVCFEGFLTDVHGACRSPRYRRLRRRISQRAGGRTEFPG
ncbi:hypothetical protein MRX96_040582 [Rhipicephalus microplus]